MAIAINDTEPRRQYTATSGQTDFDFPIPFFANGDLDVYLTPAGNTADDDADILTLNTDYTVTGAGTQSGGVVTLVNPASAGDVITIERVVDIARTADYQTAGDLLAETLNQEQDTEIMIAQQLRQDINRSFRLPTTVTGTVSTKLPSPVGNEFLRWNSAGTALETVSLTNSGTSVGDVTYENLNANGDVGTGSDQVAQGDHTHDGVYEPADATILKDADIGVTVQGYDANIPTVAASQAEMEAGTETALRSMSPLRVAQAIAALATSSAWDFESAELSVSIAAYTTITAAHGLGVVPGVYDAVLRCKTAEYGYAVGDEVLISTFRDDNGGIIATMWADATNVGFRSVNAMPNWRLVRRDTSNFANITAANWKLVMRAKA